MGDGEKTPPRLQVNPQTRLGFHGATIASDYLQESPTGRNIRHHFVPLLRPSNYSRLAGYDDTNDAERLSQDPPMRVGQ